MNISAKRSLEAPPALRRIVSYVVVISSIVLSLVTLFYLYHRQFSPICISEQAKTAIDVQPSPSCGSSPADATLAGCLFDPMNLAWQVPACHNGQLVRIFSVTYPDESTLLAGIFWGYLARRTRAELSRCQRLKPAKRLFCMSAGSS